MGFHPLDLIVIVVVGLLIFGPKTLQSLSHNAGRGVSKAKDMKDKLMAELPMEEISRVNETIARIPTSPQQMAHHLVSSALKPEKEEVVKDAEVDSKS
ncbi:MAG TPA: twin-arginine translocase TatA/TatE family subunit [Ktedonobacteraceae bacterium]